MSRHEKMSRRIGAIACLSALTMLVGCGVMGHVSAIEFGYRHKSEIGSAIADFLAIRPAYAWIQTGKVYKQADWQPLEKRGLLKKGASGVCVGWI